MQYCCVDFRDDNLETAYQKMNIVYIVLMALSPLLLRSKHVTSISVTLLGVGYVS